MLKPDEAARMVRLRELGWETRRIVRECGCGRNTVRRYLEAGGSTPHVEDASGRQAGGSGRFGCGCGSTGNAEVVRQELLEELGIETRACARWRGCRETSARPLVSRSDGPRCLRARPKRPRREHQTTWACTKARRAACRSATAGEGWRDGELRAGGTRLVKRLAGENRHHSVVCLCLWAPRPSIVPLRRRAAAFDSRQQPPHGLRLFARHRVLHLRGSGRSGFSQLVAKAAFQQRELGLIARIFPRNGERSGAPRARHHDHKSNDH